MAKAKVIVFANQKGGVGKSTAVMNLAAVLRERGKTVLAIDLDPQHTLTDFWGVTEPQYTTYDLLMSDGEWRAYETDINGYTNGPIIPAGDQLAAAELELMAGSPSWGLALTTALEPIKPHYDYILIDSLPSLTVLAVNAIWAADGIIVPCQTEIAAFNGMQLLFTTMSRTIGKIRKRYQMLDQVIAIQPTRFDGRIAHHKNVLEGLRQLYGDKVSAPVKATIKYSDGSASHLPITIYAPEERAAWDDLADRLERWADNGEK